jgi:hypothetical protein
MLNKNNCSVGNKLSFKNLGKVRNFSFEEESIKALHREGNGAELSDIKKLKFLMGDQELFYINYWLLNNPASNIRDYDSLMRLVERNKAIQLWFSEAREIWSNYSTMPKYVLEDASLHKLWNTAVLTEGTIYKSKNNLAVKELEKALALYKQAQEKYNKELGKNLDELLSKSPMAAINRISEQNLPQEDAVKAFDMDNEVYKSNLKEALERYKARLLKTYVNMETGTCTEENLKVLKKILAEK